MAIKNARLLTRGIKLTHKKHRFNAKKMMPYEDAIGLPYLLFLKRNGTTRAFDYYGITYAFSAGWSDFRNAKRFSFTDISVELTALATTVQDAMRVITHVSFNGQLYSVPRRDGDKPFIKEFTWKIYAQVLENEMFTIEDIE